MSNQGWGRLPRRDRTIGEKVFDGVTWPFRKVFGGLLMLVMVAVDRKRR